jgi:hypothetical protein
MLGFLANLSGVCLSLDSFPRLNDKGSFYVNGEIFFTPSNGEKGENLGISYGEVVGCRVDLVLLPMSNLTIHHSHDGFFKHALSKLTVAKDLLQAHLSPSITQRIQ